MKRIYNFLSLLCVIASVICICHGYIDKNTNVIIVFTIILIGYCIFIISNTKDE
jgi:hypothetical protein